MQAVIDFLATPARYIMLAIALYVVARMLLAMFFKKTTDPVRGKLINIITNEAVSLYDRETATATSPASTWSQGI